MITKNQQAIFRQLKKIVDESYGKDQETHAAYGTALTFCVAVHDNADPAGGFLNPDETLTRVDELLEETPCDAPIAV